MRLALFALLSGASLTLAAAPFDFWPLAWLAPLVLLLILDQQSVARATWLGWLFGLGLFASGASWVYVSIHEHGHAPVPLALLLTGLFVAGLALFFALHAWIWQRFLAGRWVLLSWPALWVVMEIFRSWFLTGFPWLLLGSSQISSPLAGWAPLLGVYGVSGLCVLLGLLLLQVWRPNGLPPFSHAAMTRLKTSHRRWISSGLLASLLIAGLLLQPVQWTQPQGSPLTLALVQGNIAQEDKWNPQLRGRIIHQYLRLSEAATAQEIDLLLWPETALPLLPDQAAPFFARALSHAGPEAGLISGLVSRETSTSAFHNSLVTAGGASGIYHKSILVPFGEYVPLERYLRGLIAFFDLPMSSFQPGSPPGGQLSFGETQIAPLICYEIAYADFTARQAQESHWLLTVSNDSWFGASIGPLQHRQIAQMRALETGRPLARATNNGVTALIDHHGRITQQLPQFEDGVLIGQLQPRTGQTPFMLWGSWLAGGFSLLLLLAARWWPLPRRDAH
ncbi:apolipoprotein N-acyltransferase [Marinospirillum sp. MEB164]|uniref:Apolipoprotein N-acyltransferase n=1 Tax=Marinospirillum alkalitolerans TaxID=3123374 RepID=A0ABW8PX37_9GAMM